MPGTRKENLFSACLRCRKKGSKRKRNCALCQEGPNVVERRDSAKQVPAYCS